MNFNNNEFTLLSDEQTFESQQIDVIHPLSMGSLKESGTIDISLILQKIRFRNLSKRFRDCS